FSQEHPLDKPSILSQSPEEFHRHSYRPTPSAFLQANSTGVPTGQVHGRSYRPTPRAFLQASLSKKMHCSE
ncbi:hypothetical protein LEMLEM_LOCUS24744, partial [Lemmus lemmus]